MNFYTCDEIFVANISYDNSLNYLLVLWEKHKIWFWKINKATLFEIHQLVIKSNLYLVPPSRNNILIFDKTRIIMKNMIKKRKDLERLLIK
jgi:hypothetical protein